MYFLVSLQLGRALWLVLAKEMLAGWPLWLPGMKQWKNGKIQDFPAPIGHAIVTKITGF